MTQREDKEIWEVYSPEESDGWSAEKRCWFNIMRVVVVICIGGLIYSLMRLIGAVL